MRLRRVLATALTAVVLGTGIGVVLPAEAQAGGTVSAFLNHLNSLRAANGLPALALTGDLSAVAQAHSQAMAASCPMPVPSPLPSSCLYHNSTLTTDITNWQTVGENVGFGQSEAGIDQAFDNSKGHRANELNTSYTQVGIGLVNRSDGNVFVTLDFRRPMNASSPAAAPQKTSSGQSSTSHHTQKAANAADQAAAAAAAQAAAAQAAQEAQAAAKAAAHAAADQQAAALTRELRTSDDPIARALVFSAHVNTMGQAS